MGGRGIRVGKGARPDSSAVKTWRRGTAASSAGMLESVEVVDAVIRGGGLEADEDWSSS